MPIHTAEIFKCANCAAPLPAAYGPVVVCQFCRAENRVEAKPPAPAPLPQIPFIDASRAQPLPYYPPPVQSSGGKLALVIALTTLVPMLVVPIVIFTSAQHAAAPTPAPMAPGALAAPAAPAEEKFYAWWGGQELCLADANGDGVLDPIGRASVASGSVVTALDGKTGKVIWTAPFASDASPELRCTSEAVMLEQKGFRLERLDPRTGQVAWSLKLPDKIDAVAAGHGCVRVKTSDGAIANLDLGTGKPGPCTATFANEVWFERERRIETQGVLVGDVNLRIKKTSPGTARTQITATRAAKQLWQKTLEITPVSGFSKGMLFTTDGVFLVGEKPGESGTVTFACVRAATGDVLYQHEWKGNVHTVGTLGLANGAVMLGADGDLIAFDVTTGNERWRAKSR